MRIGVPKEIKNHEYRVGLTPSGVGALAARGHGLYVQSQAGAAIGISDEHYKKSGAHIVPDAESLFAEAELIVKVKEPLAPERKLLRAGQILFAYLHLAPDKAQTDELIDSGAVCIAYETVTDASNALPLLRPMSQIAGRMSVQASAHWLETAAGGKGILIGGVPGVRKAKIAIIGGGVVGVSAALIALGMGGDVTVFDKNPLVLDALDRQFQQRIHTRMPYPDAIADSIAESDVVIGAVLVKGETAPRVISRNMLSRMENGGVLVDVSIDQGGCAESSRVTSHAEPTYIEEGIIHYCVSNMPGVVAQSSTHALEATTLPFVCALADKGWQQALRDDPHFMNGLNICEGHVCCEPVAQAQNKPWKTPQSVLN